jgi:hypothetical protein
VQVAPPWVLVSGVHSWVFPMLNETGWPLSELPDAVSVAVRVSSWCAVRKLAVSAIGRW